MNKVAVAATVLALTIPVGFVDASESIDDNTSQKKALFGELHLHTSWSMDAYAFRVRATPDDAFRFGKGQPLAHPLGQVYQLSRPLDFMAVTDHAAYMGALKNMGDPNHSFSKLDLAKEVLSSDPKISNGAFFKVSGSIRTRTPIAEISDPSIQKETWQRLIETANHHNAPGRFTALIGYEWTASSGGRNLHRNVIFSGDNAPIPYTAMESNIPENLWSWMDLQRENGYRLLAIPHNSNLSAGAMFDQKDSFGKPLTEKYTAQRMRNEPLVEVTQIKGTSEVHPSLSPNDEFADFELVEQWIAQSKPLTVFKGGYVRDAYRTGLEYQDKEGFNPYRFGLIGASDNHTAIVPEKEKDYAGSSTALSTKSRMATKGNVRMNIQKWGASGIAGVWASSNTRDGVYSALERKESWATTGPRIQLRFFGGWEMENVKPNENGWVKEAYKAGVSMGGDLGFNKTKSAPTFVVWALKDVESANLDRIQIIKGWSVDGISKENIYNVALSDSRKVNPKTGDAPAVGNTVDLKTLTYRNDIGAIELSAHWKDPDFDATQNAFYYVRALEIPTPRWSSFAAKELKMEIPDDLPATLQERAYSSPIWYNTN